MADTSIDAQAVYEAYASGQKTINAIADEYHVDAFVVADVIQQYMTDHRSTAVKAEPTEEKSEPTEEKPKKDKK
jgi:transposase-like protein